MHGAHGDDPQRASAISHRDHDGQQQRLYGDPRWPFPARHIANTDPDSERLTGVLAAVWGPACLSFIDFSAGIAGY
jgi:hypothetical protein